MGGLVWTEKRKKVMRIIGVTGAVYLSFRFLLPLFAPFLMAGLIGMWLHPAVEWAAKHARIPRGLCTVVLVGGLLSGLAFGSFWLVRVLIDQLQLLAEKLPIFEREMVQWAHACCGKMEHFLQLSDGALWQRMTPLVEQAGGRLQEWSVHVVMDQTLPLVRSFANTGAWIAVFVIGTIMIARDWGELRDLFVKSAFGGDWLRLGKRLSDVGQAYVQSEVTCLFAVTSVSAVGLWLLGNPYGLLLACGIGVIDLLPIFGAGTVYVPWVVISLFQGKYMQSAVLGGMYVICYLLRNMIEARKMGDRLGFHPIVTLCAVYAGWKLFGLAGFLLGPIGLVIVAEFA